MPLVVLITKENGRNYCYLRRKCLSKYLIASENTSTVFTVAFHALVISFHLWLSHQQTPVSKSSCPYHKPHQHFPKVCWWEPWAVVGGVSSRAGTKLAVWTYACNQTAKLNSRTHGLGCKTTLRELACFWIQLCICTRSQNAQCKEAHLGEYGGFGLNDQLVDPWETQNTEFLQRGRSCLLCPVKKCNEVWKTMELDL